MAGPGFRRRVADVESEVEGVLDGLEKEKGLEPPPPAWRRWVRRHFHGVAREMMDTGRLNRTGRFELAIEKVGVAGCGLMGSGIVEVSAKAGCDVVVREIDDGALAAGKGRIVKSLDRAVGKGKLDAAARTKRWRGSPSPRHWTRSRTAIW